MVCLFIYELLTLSSFSSSDHGHSHGHSHSPLKLQEDPINESDTLASKGSGRRQRERADSMSSLYAHPAQTRASVIETAQEFGYGRSNKPDEGRAADPLSPSSVSHHRTSSVSRKNASRGPGSRPRTNRMGGSGKIMAEPGDGATKSPLSPPLPRQDSTPGSSGIRGSTVVTEPVGDHDHAGHTHLAKSASQAEEGTAHAREHGEEDGHGHSHESGGHGHSHGSMNMRGVFLHVLGDALGNVGVIAAGLVIWFCEGRWTLYFDPGVSLLITGIIFSSAIPLGALFQYPTLPYLLTFIVKSASYILLQGVPSHVSLDEVRSSLREIDGVVSVHELHVWQLSETTTVASVHVLIRPGMDYMVVAGEIREKMHGHGIHSVTIQPEFYNEDDDQSVRPPFSYSLKISPDDDRKRLVS
jgi:zinc transporter 1